MGFNFPSPAIPGQIYAPVGGPVYEFNDGIWSTAMSGPQVSPGKRAIVSPFDFGGIGNGTTDDTSAIQQAIDYLYTTFAGGTVDMSGGRWLVDSGDIRVKSGVWLAGSVRNAGTVAGVGGSGSRDWSAVRSAIVLNPAYTVMLVGDGCGVEGLNILRKGMTVATTARQALDEVNSFAGTAITNGDPAATGNPCDENYIGHCFIAGFAYAYRDAILSTGRVWIEYVQGDCINGIHIQYSYDVQHLSHCHFWPHVTGGIGMLEYAVSNMVNNGSGLIRVTIPTHVLVTGDIVNIGAVLGTTEARGRWTITVINSTTIDLQGSAFVNAYVSGGFVRIYPGARHGIAYDFAETIDWGQADHCFAYGYDVGFSINNANDCTLLACSVDHFATTQDLTTIGIRVMGTSRNAKLIGCRTAAQGDGVLVDCGTQSVAITTCEAWGGLSNGIHVVTGYALVTGSLFYNLPVAVRVEPAAGGAYVVGNRASGSVTTPIVVTGTALEKVTTGQNSWTDATVGERRVSVNDTPHHYRTVYNATASGPVQRYRKARGTPDSPVGASSSDTAIDIRADFWDGVNQFRTGGSWRVQASGATSASNAGAIHIWNAVANGATTGTDVLAMSASQLYPLPNQTVNLGGSANKWLSVFSDKMYITDGVTAPGTAAGLASIYVDIADGDLKIKFGDGTIKTIMVDT